MTLHHRHHRITRLLASTLILIVSLTCVTRADLQPKDLIAICGDSITEQKQYSVFMQTYLLACQPTPDLRAMQFGWGGEVSWGFVARMDNDVLRFNPTVATTCYGMNDGGYAPLSDERAQRYREAHQQIIQKLKDAGVRFIVIGSPGAVDADTFRKDPEQADMYNETLAQLRDIGKELAQQNSVAFADVFSPMMHVMAEAKKKYGPEYHVAGADGVHPAANGHLVMAYAFLKALGCDGEIGTITMDFSTGKADATAGHTVLESSPGVVEIISARYPFCFYGDASSPTSTRGVIEFLPFNDELNRLILVVRNAPAPRLKVTWGDASKEFTKEQLEQGINLAAEFLDNPFSGPFMQVQEAVRAQQNYETPLVKQLVHNLTTFKEMVPSESEALDRIVESATKRDVELQHAARESVKPVRHRIVVEEVE